MSNTGSFAFRNTGLAVSQWVIPSGPDLLARRNEVLQMMRDEARSYEESNLDKIGMPFGVDLQTVGFDELYSLFGRKVLSDELLEVVGEAVDGLRAMEQEQAQHRKTELIVALQDAAERCEDSSVPELMVMRRPKAGDRGFLLSDFDVIAEGHFAEVGLAKVGDSFHIGVHPVSAIEKYSKGIEQSMQGDALEWQKRVANLALQLDVQECENEAMYDALKALAGPDAPKFSESLLVRIKTEYFFGSRALEGVPTLIVNEAQQAFANRQPAMFEQDFYFGMEETLKAESVLSNISQACEYLQTLPACVSDMYQAELKALTSPIYQAVCEVAGEQNVSVPEGVVLHMPKGKLLVEHDSGVVERSAAPAP